MFRLYFGNPGCGKTTFACKQLKEYKKKKKKYGYDRFYSNFDNELSQKICLNGLGSWTLPFNSYLVIDEAGITYNNRKFKSLDQQTIEWFKLHRHYGVDVDFISQSWEDIDITIRRLVDEVWYIKKVGCFTVVRRIFKEVKVDENTHQIVDGYRSRKLLGVIWDKICGITSMKIFIRAPYYKYFDTYDAPKRPVRYAYDIPPSEPSLLDKLKAKLRK